MAETHLQRCSICRKTGHNSRRHENEVQDRCSTCHRHGHKTPTCPFEEQNVEQMRNPVAPPPGFTLTRDSTTALSQSEVDMATRVLLACHEEKAFGVLTSSVIERACKMTGLGRRKIVELNVQLKNKQIPQGDCEVRGKWERYPEHRHILTNINDTVEKLHKSGTMTSLRKIRQALDFYHGILVSKSLLRRIMLKMGYRYKAPGPNSTLLAIETEGMRAIRLQYLKDITEARKKGPIIYIDESYVNDRHQSSKCWLKQGSQVYVPSGRGPRYILYGAGSKNGWVSKPTVFPYKDASADYHNGMNANHFEELFRTTCMEAADKLGSSTIIMDNAAYHRRLVDEKHRISYWNTLPAAEVKLAWKQNEVPGQSSYKGPEPKYKKDIISWLRKNPPKGESRVHAIAREFGHWVLMLPPYRPELNAIETAWAVGKNYVARHNSAQQTFANLLYVVQKGLEEVTLPVWSSLDEKVEKTEQAQLTELSAEEARRQTFRDEHPDLVFEVTGSDSESEDDEDHSGEKEDPVEDVIVALSEGVNGDDLPLEDVVQDCEDVIHDDEYENMAARTLLELSNVKIFEE